MQAFDDPILALPRLQPEGRPPAGQIVPIENRLAFGLVEGHVGDFDFAAVDGQLQSESRCGVDSAPRPAVGHRHSPRGGRRPARSARCAWCPTATAWAIGGLHGLAGGGKCVGLSRFGQTQLDPFAAGHLGKRDQRARPVRHAPLPLRARNLQTSSRKGVCWRRLSRPACADCTPAHGPALPGPSRPASRAKSN